MGHAEKNHNLHFELEVSVEIQFYFLLKQMIISSFCFHRILLPE